MSLNKTPTNCWTICRAGAGSRNVAAGQMRDYTATKPLLLAYINMKILVI